MSDLQTKVDLLLKLCSELTVYKPHTIHIAIHESASGSSVSGQYIALVHMGRPEDGHTCGDYKPTMGEAIESLARKIIDMADRECIEARRIDVARRALIGEDICGVCGSTLGGGGLR